MALSLLVLVVLIRPAVQYAWAQAPGVVVLVSSDAAPYADALDGFLEVLGRHAPEVGIEVEIMRSEDTTPTPALDSGASPALVFTLGTRTTRDVAATIGGTPLVAGMVLNADELSGISNATGVYLEHSAATEIEWLRKLLPDRRRVGIVYSEATAARVAALKRAATSANLSVYDIEITSTADIERALDTLANRSDVILGLADPLVFNAQTVKPLLMFSFAERIPIVASSAGWVQAGAIYALERDYTDVGAQSADLALQILAGRRASTLAPEAPRKVDYVLNERTASELNITIPASLLRAAREVVR